MLILPIVSGKRVINVEIRLKSADKIRRSVTHDKENMHSNIIVNRERFSDSSFASSKDVNAPIDFIRSKSILYPRSFLVTTKKSDDSSFDVYEVGQPPRKISDGLDELYSKAILDIKNEVPDRGKRGRYVSLEDLGFAEYLGDEKIARLQELVRDGSGNLGDKLREAGLTDLIELVDFFNNFECCSIEDSSISESSLEESIKALGVINSRDYRNLKKYYKMAKSNSNIYTKISYISKIVYDKPLTIFDRSERAKQLVKTYDERELKNAS